MKLLKTVVQVIFVEEDEGGNILRELPSEPMTVFGVDGIRAFADKVQEMLDDSPGDA